MTEIVGAVDVSEDDEDPLWVAPGSVFAVYPEETLPGTGLWTVLVRSVQGGELWVGEGRYDDMLARCERVVAKLWPVTLERVL